MARGKRKHVAHDDDFFGSDAVCDEEVALVQLCGATPKKLSKKQRRVTRKQNEDGCMWQTRELLQGDLSPTPMKQSTPRNVRLLQRITKLEEQVERLKKMGRAPQSIDERHRSDLECTVGVPASSSLRAVTAYNNTVTVAVGDYVESAADYVVEIPVFETTGREVSARSSTVQPHWRTLPRDEETGGTFISQPISPKRVEVRCNHVSTSERVFNVNSVTLRSRLSRPCENPECRYKSEQKETEHAHEKSSRRKERNQREWILHEERALERERELLRQDRLLLEEERRQIQYERQKLDDARRRNDGRYRASPVSRVGRRYPRTHCDSPQEYPERTEEVSPPRRGSLEVTPPRSHYDACSPEHSSDGFPDNHYVADNVVQTAGRKRRRDFDSDCLHNEAVSNHCYGHSTIECERFGEQPRSPKCFRRDSPLFGSSRSAYTHAAGQDFLDDHWSGSGGEEDMDCLSFSSTMEPTDDVLMIP